MFVPVLRAPPPPPPPPTAIDCDEYLGALIERFGRRSARSRPYSRLSIGEIANKYRGRRDWTESTSESVVATAPSAPTHSAATQAFGPSSLSAESDAGRHVRIAPQDLDPARKCCAHESPPAGATAVADAELMPWLGRPLTPGRPWDADSESSASCHDAATEASPPETSSPTDFRRPRSGRRFEAKSEPPGLGSPEGEGTMRRVSAPPPKGVEIEPVGDGAQVEESAKLEGSDKLEVTQPEATVEAKRKPGGPKARPVSSKSGLALSKSGPANTSTDASSAPCKIPQPKPILPKAPPKGPASRKENRSPSLIAAPSRPASQVPVPLSSSAAPAPSATTAISVPPGSPAPTRSSKSRAARRHRKKAAAASARASSSG